jgi:formylglycine-generating enzyme required for sulfatase activity
MDKLVVAPNGKGELVLIRDPRALENTGSLFVLPRIARFWSTDAFYYFYEKYYDCAKPTVGDIWIIDPAVVSKVQGGWKRKKKGVMEVRSDGKTNSLEEAPSSSAPSDRVLPVTAYEEPEQVETFTTSRSSRLLKALPLVLAFVGIFLAIGIFWSLNRSTDLTLTNANSGTVTVPSPSPTMALIPGGEFTMGSDSGDDYEKPAHPAVVKPFFIDINEVTCDDYATFMKATGHQAPVGWVRGTYPAGLGRRPVTGVDWDDANAYAHWAKKRLPTEEEWEFAARNSTGATYPWGNEWIAGMANANKASKYLTEVGSFKPTSRGLFDMIGNAWEWTSTSIHSYPRGRIDEDQLSQALRDKMKVIRGGCYLSDSNQATNTYRRGWPPASGPYDFAQTGFRCARDAPK